MNEKTQSADQPVSFIQRLALHLRREPGAAAMVGGASMIMIGIVAAMLAGLPVSSPAAPVSGGERAHVEAIVRDYILAHPEIIPEAIKRLQDREVAQVLNSTRDSFETPFAGAWAGAEDGDVTLVEFFDYACPYCRASVPDVRRLLEEDKKLKVVWRDFPVLGPDSEEAALASLSAAQQGHYHQFYDTMFAGGRPSREAVINAVRKARMNEVQTANGLKSAELKAEIQKNLELGRTLGLTGTPSYIIGNRILAGAVGYDELKKAIAEARAGN